MNGYIRLSPNFLLAEFLVSQTASRAGRPITVDPDTLIAANLQRLCYTALEPARNISQAPIHVTSGLRPLWLNTIIGGSKNSQHMQGLAADIVSAKLSSNDFFMLIKNSDIPYDQLILEFDRWVHISISAILVPPRRQALSVTGSRSSPVWTVYN